MAQLFDQLEPEHIEFIDRQRLFFVATATDGAHPNLSPKAYCSLAVLDPRRLIHVDWPGSGNQTATHIAEHGRVTLMFLSFERAPLILRVFGSAKVLHRRSREFAALVPLLGERVGPHTRQMFDIAVERVQSSCGYAVPLFDYRGERDTLRRYHDRKHDEVDWDAYLDERTRPQAPVVTPSRRRAG